VRKLEAEIKNVREELLRLRTEHNTIANESAAAHISPCNSAADTLPNDHTADATSTGLLLIEQNVLSQAGLEEERGEEKQRCSTVDTQLSSPHRATETTTTRTDVEVDRIIKLEARLEKAFDETRDMLKRWAQASRAGDDAEYKYEAEVRKNANLEREMAYLLALAHEDKLIVEAELQKAKVKEANMIKSFQSLLSRQQQQHQMFELETGLLLLDLEGDNDNIAAIVPSTSVGVVAPSFKIMGEGGMADRDHKYHPDPRAHVRVPAIGRRCPILIRFSYKGNKVAFPFLTPPNQEISIFELLNTSFLLAAKLEHTVPPGTNILTYMGIYKFTWTAKHPTSDSLVPWEIMINAYGDHRRQEILLHQWLQGCPWGTVVEAHQYTAAAV
jgi:hypothetical protein